MSTTSKRRAATGAAEFSILNGKTERVPVDRLVRHPQNPRRGKVEAIRESIAANGFYGALVAQKSTGHVLVGNHRLEAAQAEGARELPVIWVDVDDATALRILLADNRTNDLATYDEPALAALLQEIEAETGDLLGTGYDAAALDALLAGLAPADGHTDPDDAPEAPAKPKARTADLWALGRHRLLCGDATSEIDVLRLIDGAKPRLMVTDPPYGVDYDPDWRNDAAQAGARSMGPPTGRAVGRVSNDARADWRNAWLLSPATVVYAWHGALNAHEAADALVAAGFELRVQVIWRKSHHAINRGHYHWQHEPCWYAVRKGGTASWCGDRSQTSVWDIDVVKNDTGHSTQKPLECMERPLRNHTGDVYDPFLGTGTTLIAAERLGRTCYGLEIDPRYCDVIVERWQNFTGEKAEKLT